MKNPNLFREQGSGEDVCPSGCLSTDACSKSDALALLLASYEKSSALKDPKVTRTMLAVRGDHLPIAAEATFAQGLESALGGSCLRFHLMQEDLTENS